MRVRVWNSGRSLPAQNLQTCHSNNWNKYAFWKLERLLKDQSFPLKTKLSFFQATCLSVLLYGCESWVLTQDMKNEINPFSMSCYCIMLNIKRTDRTVSMMRYTPKWELDHLSPLSSSANCASWATNSAGIQRNLPICMPCISPTPWEEEAWQAIDKLSEVHSGTTGWQKFHVVDGADHPNGLWQNCLEKSYGRLLYHSRRRRRRRWWWWWWWNTRFKHQLSSNAVLDYDLERVDWILIIPHIKTTLKLASSLNSK